MIGMLQIIIGMGCVYLVMKAIAITQAGLSAPPENRRRANFYSALAAVLGVGGAVWFLMMMLEHSDVVAGLSPAPY